MQTLAAAYFFMLAAQAQPMPARPAAAPVPAAPTIRCPQGEVPYRVVRMTPVRGATRVDFVGVHDGRRGWTQMGAHDLARRRLQPGRLFCMVPDDEDPNVDVD